MHLRVAQDMGQGGYNVGDLTLMLLLANLANTK